MSNFSEESTNILIQWLRKVEIEIFEQNKAGYEERGRDVGKAIGAIYDLDKKKSSENVPASKDFQVDRQWTDTILNELFSFNEMGAEYICSITEATIKTNGLKKLLTHTDSSPMFFRGEHIFGWELISRLGRRYSLSKDDVDNNKVTQLELELLREFQSTVKSDKKLRIKIFANSPIISDSDVGWWSIMQHYDKEYGTRMIDISSSLYSALYFACANWDGTVDEANDGKLYMFPYPPGRTETNTPDMFKDQVVGSEDKIETTVETYFNVKSSFDIPRFRISPVMNNRALSQDGYFVWQRDYDKPLKLMGNHFPFRVHRDYKKSIIKELEAIGYTRDRILAENRFDREQI